MKSQKYIVARREEIEMIPTLIRGCGNVLKTEMGDKVFFTADQPQALRRLQQEFDNICVDYTETWL